MAEVPSRMRSTDPLQTEAGEVLERTLGPDETSNFPSNQTFFVETPESFELADSGVAAELLWQPMAAPRKQPLAMPARAGLLLLIKRRSKPESSPFRLFGKVPSRANIFPRKSCVSGVRFALLKYSYL